MLVFIYITEKDQQNTLVKCFEGPTGQKFIMEKSRTVQSAVRRKLVVSVSHSPSD